MTPTLRDDLAADLRLALDDAGMAPKYAGQLADRLIALGWTKPLPVVRRLREERDEARAEVERLRAELAECQDPLVTEVYAKAVPKQWNGSERIARAIESRAKDVYPDALGASARAAYVHAAEIARATR